MNSQKRAGQFQLRLTEHLKEKVVELAKDDGISQNAILNQAVAWYVKAREKDVA
ncbi:TPA: toxin-antitoxin system HicB family antitoxin [Morganella morganii]|jgi:predicted HicB family RNase H-like nuclease|uniref:Toxin-antitoxin system HicB family antitoxin n=1 Tax=Morganella morganii TaxID=582 RepID=A0AAN5ME06_MORMO|nr:toxin-antitoxin system HicB family antitoxin [Morganella morganii]HED3889081.1 toxin-antitoxin system HicB family antitoxin [Morganella morganii]